MFRDMIKVLVNISKICLISYLLLVQINLEGETVKLPPFQSSISINEYIHFQFLNHIHIRVFSARAPVSPTQLTPIMILTFSPNYLCY